MINFLLRIITKRLLRLRYRIRVSGLEKIARKGRRRILFLPNHPALIDPIILLACLHKSFAPRALAVAHQIDRFFIRRLARRFGVHPFEDPVRTGAGSRRGVEAAVAACIEDLRRGDNLVLYPSGHVYRTYIEGLRGNTAVETVLREVPDVRIVLVRMRGLWGSGFSWASGEPPNVGRALKKGILAMLAGGLLFMPRRRVSIELYEPDDLPIAAGRNAINEYIEKWYNADAPHNTYVPYYIWERGGARQRPEPITPKVAGDLSAVPESTRRTVTDYLRELTGAAEFGDDDDLARDLGLDSLARAESLAWLESEFGFPQANVGALRTVGDAMQAACGQLVATEPKELQSVAGKWLPKRPHPQQVIVPHGRTITDVFLAQARRRGGKPVIADQRSGVKTYRDLILAILALKPKLADLPGERLGIMLPASVAADVAYLATLFAGKTPVMVNWTVGRRNLNHCLEITGVQKILTAKAIVGRIESQGTDLGDLRDRFVFLEELAGSLSTMEKLSAWMKSRFNWSSLTGARVSATAVILFTSGSETLPKAVPLTHENILANIRDIAGVVRIRADECMIGMLPPFHSFGLTATVITPLVLGIRAVYWPDPTEAGMIARIIKSYAATMLIGTPTFLNRIVSAAIEGQLKTLRLAVTGAEKCPKRVYDILAERCPRTVVLEGYGVTECSPIISINDERTPLPLTIGKPLPSLEYAIVDDDNHIRVAPGRAGMLLVCGPSVFDGYLNYDGPPPFVEFEGQSWYRTGDLVSEDAGGVLTFRGRLKRFVKLGGEMISLPAVEAVLEPHLSGKADDRPVFAVANGGTEEQPELVLFTTRKVDRLTVNGWIREAGLSPLHNIRRIAALDEIPLLGTGKVDYRSHESMLRK